MRGQASQGCLSPTSHHKPHSTSACSSLISYTTGQSLLLPKPQSCYEHKFSSSPELLPRHGEHFLPQYTVLLKAILVLRDPGVLLLGAYSFRDDTYPNDSFANCPPLSDAFTRREQASEAKYIREKEMERYKTSPSHNVLLS